MLSESDKLKVCCQFVAYCKKTITNRAIDYRRQNQKRWDTERCLDDFTDVGLEKYLLDEVSLKDSPSFYYAEGRCYTSENLAEAIESLDVKKRNIIKFHYFKHMTDQQIGELYGLSGRCIAYHRKNALESIYVFLKGNGRGN